MSDTENKGAPAMTQTPTTPEAVERPQWRQYEGMPWYRKSDYDALSARLSEVEAERDGLKVQLAVQRGHTRALREDRNIERQRGDIYKTRTQVAESKLATALVTARQEANQSVLQSVGETLAGLKYHDVSVSARDKIKAAIDRTLATPQEKADG
jgi:hypothetical protein